MKTDSTGKNEDFVEQNRHKTFFGFQTKDILEFLGVTALIFFLGYVVHCNILHMISAALENNVAQHIETITQTLDERATNELQYLSSGAELLGRGLVTPEALVAYKNSQYEKFKLGVVSKDGKILAGESLAPEDIPKLQRAFNGVQFVEYHKGIGLIFAVPVRNANFEVTSVVCEIYTEEGLQDRFKMLGYNGEGTIVLFDDQRKWNIVAQGKDVIPEGEQVEKAFHQLLENTERNGFGTLFFENDDKAYFLFGALGHGRAFIIAGYVPWSTVAVGLEYIHMAMLGILCTMITLLIVVVKYFLQYRETQRFKEEKEVADQANQAKSEFLSNMSHEIRTPINAVLGMDEMILRECKEETILEYAENIRISGNSLLSLVNDILDFSKIEAGKMDIIPVEYHLSSLLNDLVNMIQTRAQKKNLHFEVKCSPEIPSVLFGDEIRIKQVITNILTNAVKYTEQGCVTMNVDFYRKTNDDSKIILGVAVADTGIGIKEEDISKLFTAFERIEEKRNRTIEGTGLGMNITQRLLSMMGSKLQVESVYGEGSIFSFEIEQKVVSEEPIGDFEEAFKRSLAQHQTYHQKFTAPTARILVVDDTPMNLTVVKGLLKQTQVQIDTAESGKKALELVAINHYDLIFLDHRMPEMDGIETLKYMKGIWIHETKVPPVISLTANAISGAREQYIAAGFQDYLTKPINSDQLEAMMIKYLPSEKVNLEAVDESETKIEIPEWITKLEGINSEVGIQNCGSVDDFENALRVFANSIESNSKEIEEFFKAEDWKNYTTKVHALKSTARIIGANELSDRARRLEDAGNQNYIDEIKKDTPELLNLYRSYLKKLSTLIKTEEDDSNKPLIGESELAEAYQTLKEVSATFDYDTASFVVNSLADYRLPESERERYKNLKVAVEKLDWDQVNKLIA